jgi:hypothetical protein
MNDNGARLEELVLVSHPTYPYLLLVRVLHTYPYCVR